MHEHRSLHLQHESHVYLIADLIVVILLPVVRESSSQAMSLANALKPHYLRAHIERAVAVGCPRGSNDTP